MPVPDFLPSDAAPTYERELPGINLGRAWAVALLMFVVGFGAWEWKWRAFGAEPSIRNSDGLWAIQRRQLSAAQGNRTVIIGSSRVLFDIQLSVWEQLTGERPFQLALEGTSPIFVLEDLADDTNYNGRLLIGVTPPLYFTGRGRRELAVKNWNKETLAQRAAQWLSMQLVEPLLSYYHEDFALVTILERQNWPAWRGVPGQKDVRRLNTMDKDRNARMWSKVENDQSYQAIAKDIWTQTLFHRVGTIPPPVLQGLGEEQIKRTVAAVEKLRARGVRMVFVRAPASGEFLEFENKAFPRATTWDLLLHRTGLPGIHFEEYPELQGYELPEWSHMTGKEAKRFTGELWKILQRDLGWSQAP